MPRPVDPQIRKDLLASIVEAVEHLGLADFSLRPLAGAIGSSPRAILYHFGSKEQLVAEIIASGRARATLLASLVLATVHGLSLDLIATGDRARVDRAFASFIAAIELPLTRTR